MRKVRTAQSSEPVNNRPSSKRETVPQKITAKFGKGENVG